MNRIFVGGLKDTTPKSEIENYFRRFGRIKKIFMPQAKTENKEQAASEGKLNPQEYSVQGYVFIKYFKVSSADKALSLSSHELAGKKIDVERAYIIEGSVNESLSRLQLKLFFKGFPIDTGKEELVACFCRYGQLRSLRMVNKNGKGIGFVVFRSPDTVQLLLELKKIPFEKQGIKYMVTSSLF